MRISNRTASWLVLIALFALALVPVTGVAAHDGSFAHLARRHFHTKAAANERFVTERWAVVDSAGTLVRGEKVVSATRTGEGTYQVLFNRDVSACAYNVTPLAENGAFPKRSAVASTGGFRPADTVGVAILSSAGAFLDGGFSITVTC